MLVRSKTVSTKVADAEFEQMEQLAAASGQSMSEWVRLVLLAQLNPASEVILAEILALRNILINLAHAQHKGERLTLGDIQELIKEADTMKLRKAAERLKVQGKVESNELPGTE